MLLNNLSVYQDILKKSRHEIVQREDKRYEVERLYSTSPIIFDYSETYLPDGMYMVEETVSICYPLQKACDSFTEINLNYHFLYLGATKINNI